MELWRSAEYWKISLFNVRKLMEIELKVILQNLNQYAEFERKFSAKWNIFNLFYHQFFSPKTHDQNRNPIPKLTEKTSSYLLIIPNKNEIRYFYYTNFYFHHFNFLFAIFRNETNTKYTRNKEKFNGLIFDCTIFTLSFLML